MKHTQATAATAHGRAHRCQRQRQHARCQRLQRYRRQHRLAKRQRRLGHRLPHYRKNWLDCQRAFLSAAVWKALRRLAGSLDGRRWHLVVTLSLTFLMLFLSDRDDAARFQHARTLWSDLNPSRKRPGKTLTGYRKAVQRLPWRVVRGLAPLLRPSIADKLAPRWYVGNWIPFGIDGTELDLPRTKELEQYFADKHNEVPHLWLSCVVHAGTGVPWSWRFGAGTSNERTHLLSLQPTLPEGSLLLADAGFVGYEVWSELERRQQPFLMRVGTLCQFYVDWDVTEARADGCVYAWPKQHRSQRPLLLRLLRIRERRGSKNEVWLATNVLQPERLSKRTAGQMYRLRWENEVFFRSYKCTLGKAKLTSRTAKQALREAELSMVATQLLLAQTTWALVRAGEKDRKASLKGAVTIFQQEMTYLGRHRRLQAGYLGRLRAAMREQRPRNAAEKEQRQRSQKKRPPPGRPRITTMSMEFKAKLYKKLNAA